MPSSLSQKDDLGSNNAQTKLKSGLTIPNTHWINPKQAITSTLTDSNTFWTNHLVFLKFHFHCHWINPKQSTQLLQKLEIDWTPTPTQAFTMQKSILPFSFSNVLESPINKFLRFWVHYSTPPKTQIILVEAFNLQSTQNQNPDTHFKFSVFIETYLKLLGL